MPPQATATQARILTSAKAEFLACGFAGASLRTIAKNAGVTTGALYRHFASKAELFDALVATCFENFMAMYHRATEDFMHQLDTCGMDWGSSEPGLLAWVGHIYDNLDAFRLLLCAAEKTAYESFTHTVVDLEVDTTLEYITRARAKGYPVRDIGRQELHMFVSAQFSVLFELVLHDVPRDTALEYTKSINCFFTAGWRALFMQAP